MADMICHKVCELLMSILIVFLTQTVYILALRMQSYELTVMWVFVRDKPENTAGQFFSPVSPTVYKQDDCKMNKLQIQAFQETLLPYLQSGPIPLYTKPEFFVIISI
jgi:hypothetical protein